jgi:2-(1,2-epoxy-1,2-dihydrophenyl)acetyl-CoA isomerase
VPVIAAVNGVAAGAGANFALGCDLVVAARGASFIQAFSKIGLIPDCGGTWLLPRLVGRAQALGLAMTGDKLPAEEAGAMGLIWQVRRRRLADGQRAGAGHEAGGDAHQGAGRDAPRLDEALGLDYGGALDLEARVQRARSWPRLRRRRVGLPGQAAPELQGPMSMTDTDDRPAGGRSRPRRDVEGRPRLARRWA